MSASANHFTPEQEREFQAGLEVTKVSAARQGALLAGILFAAFALQDPFILPSALKEVLFIRFALVIPFLAWIFWLSRRPFFLPHYRQLMVAMYLVMGLAIEAMVVMSHESDLARQIYPAGLFLVIFALYTWTLLDVREIAGIGLTLCAIYLAIALFRFDALRHEDGLLYLSEFMFLVAANVIGIMAVGMRMSKMRQLFLVKNSLARENAANETLLANLRASEARFKRAADSVPAMLFEYVHREDNSGEFVYASNRSRELLELEPEVLMADAMAFWTLVNSNDLPDLIEADAAANRAGTAFRHEFRVTTPSGKLKWLLVESKPDLLAKASPVSWSGYVIDITENKTANVTVQESEQRWKFALEGAGHGVWDWNLQTHRISYSTAWLAMLGYVVGDLPAETADLCDRVHPDDLERTRADLNNYLEGRTPEFATERRIEAKGGDYQWVSLRGMLVSRSKDGLPLRMIGTQTDITNEKRGTERQLYRLLEASPEGMLIVASDGRIAFANTVAENMFGYGEGGMAGHQVEELLPTGSRKAHVGQRLDYFRHPRARLMAQNQELRGMDARGREFPVQVNLSPYTLSGQSVVIAAVADITERVRANAALRAERDQSQRFLDVAPVMILVLDRHGRVQVINRTGAAMIGYEQQDLIGRDWMMTCLPTGVVLERVRGYFTAMMKGERPPASNYENEIITRTGERRLFSWTTAVMYNAGGQPSGLVTAGEDVTLQRRNEAELTVHRTRLESLVEERTSELADAKRVAEAASRSKSEFVANMSHEIRTPMNAVLGLTHLALQKTQEPKLREYLEKISQSGEHLLGIINDILDFSKIEAGRLELESIPFELAPTLAAVMQMVEDKAGQKGLTLQQQVADDVPLEFIGDPLRVSQILLNYLNNAIKFTAHGGVTLRVTCGAREATRAQVRFEAIDTGVGLSAEAAARLFRPFEQVDSSITRTFGGTGLGLAISRQLAQIMGGEVGVDSTLGQGSTFWLSVWLDIDPHPARLATPASAAAAPARFAGLRLLLAEDNAFNQLVAKDMLADAGVAVVLAENGQEALDWLEREAFDGVLMDLQMPVMDGFAATREIRRDGRWRDLPVIALTANASAEDERRCREAGMNEFISKPIRPADLLAKLGRIFGVAAEPPPPPIAADTAKTATINATAEAGAGDAAEGFDASAILKLGEGQAERMRKLLQAFDSSWSKGLAELHAAVAAGDAKAIADIGHRQKSTARWVGALAMGELCQQLEDQAKAGDLSGVGDLTGQLVLHYADVAARLKAIIEQAP